MMNKTVVKDPVCGMDVEVSRSAEHSEEQGKTYYFCGSDCKDRFDLNPEQYIGKAGGAPETRSRRK